MVVHQLQVACLGSWIAAYVYDALWRCVQDDVYYVWVHSGRTVRPKLIITCGVSGAIQFVAGMNNSEQVVAINSDPEAPIFKVANYALVGDIYEIIPQLIEKIKQGGALA